MITREQFRKLQIYSMKQLVDIFPELDLEHIMFMTTILAKYQSNLEDLMYSDELDSIIKMIEMESDTGE